MAVLPSVEEFHDALQHGLSDAQVNILKALYAMPNSSATAKQLAEKLGYPSFHRANLVVGQVGKAIAQYLEIEPSNYFNGRKETPAYFLVVGEYKEKTGWNMWPELRQALEELGIVFESATDPAIVTSGNSRTFMEGKVVQVAFDRYERNQKARVKCIEHFGDSCFACGFNFGDSYGAIASGYIHVHHKKMLSENQGEHEVDPIKDLVPLCANCHAVVHLRKEPLTIEELTAKISESVSAK